MPSAAMLSPVTVRYASGRHSSTPPGPSTLCAACTSTAPRQSAIDGRAGVLVSVTQIDSSPTAGAARLAASDIVTQINSTVGVMGSGGVHGGVAGGRA